ncbi:hypothetical protein [Streptomyces sp. ALI-76-A]|uniref:hypothetical protein n=1 Tax=Streptomyces sp. ALI-76-A TaxID=3025736 RepID=UPI00256F2937|nr:hypothetical protein [Streptomyces sp. ALI-76-A]MDL5205408.1 hypothetical protein [Streptomyces sp. ALI-76-A]
MGSPNRRPAWAGRPRGAFGGAFAAWRAAAPVRTVVRLEPPRLARRVTTASGGGAAVDGDGRLRVEPERFSGGSGGR